MRIVRGITVGGDTFLPGQEEDMEAALEAELGKKESKARMKALQERGALTDEEPRRVRRSMPKENPNRARRADTRQKGSKRRQAENGEKPSGDEIPDSFPHAALLKDNGITKFAELDAAGDLSELEGIGKARAEEIQGARK